MHIRGQKWDLVNIVYIKYFMDMDPPLFSKVSSTGSVSETTMRIFHMCSWLSHSGVIWRVSSIKLLLTIFWRMIFFSHRIMNTIRYDRWRWYPDTLDDWLVSLDLCTCIYLNEYYNGSGLCKVYPRTPQLMLAIVLREILMWHLQTTMGIWC